ncbi:MAG: hypothetical protein ACREP9_10900, partial [Candidatus Dormibacteraceae bacterium]
EGSTVVGGGSPFYEQACAPVTSDGPEREEDMASKVKPDGREGKPTNFDHKAAERSIVGIVGKKDKIVGMGAVIAHNLIATVTHCLPRDRHGHVVFPNPDELGSSPLFVGVKSLDGGCSADALIAAADPCSDMAVLSDSTFAGADLPDALKFREFVAAHEPVRMRAYRAPRALNPKGIWVHVRNQLGRWVEGTAHGNEIDFGDSDRIGGGTSGCPVFDDAGLVLGLVSNGDVNGATGRLSFLSEGLPGWVLNWLSK